MMEDTYKDKIKHKNSEYFFFHIVLNREQMKKMAFKKAGVVQLVGHKLPAPLYPNESTCIQIDPCKTTVFLDILETA